MKKKINVIDLDKTLLPYDSFRVLVKKEIKSLNIFVGLVTLLRILRLIGPFQYKEMISKHLKKKKSEEYFISFANSLIPDFDKRLISIIDSKTDSNTTNVLLSASPHLYVRYLIKKLAWKGTGSYFNDDNKFIPIFGDKKISWLKKNFSDKSYLYNYSVSDSKSDLKLLKLFTESDLWA